MKSQDSLQATHREVRRGKKRIPAMLRAIALLASGTAAGQLISLILMPIITRLYSPAEYGVLGIYIALITILGSVVGLKFEAAILLPERDATGEKIVQGLIRLSIVCVVLVSGALFLLAVILLLFWGGGPLDSLGGWLLLVPFGTLMAGVSLTLTALATREGEFRRLSKVPALQKLSSGGLQIGGGVTGLGVAGLLSGAVTQSIVTIVVLLRGRLRSFSTSVFLGRPKNELKQLASEYRDFPLINAPTSLLNTLAWNSQVIVLAWFYLPDDVGLYSLALAVVGLPLNVILTGVSQIYLRESAARRGHPKQARALFVRLLLGLLIVSIPVFIGLFLVSEYLLGPLFGAEWASAGLIAHALLPLLWGRFMATTLKKTFTVYRRQGWLLWWQIIALTVTTSGYVIGGIGAFPIEETVALASWMTLPVYLVLIPMSYYIMRRVGPAPASEVAEKSTD